MVEVTLERESESVAQQAFVRLAEREQNPSLRMVGHRLRGLSALMTGDSAAAVDDARRAIALYQPKRDRALAFLYGHDVRIAAQSNLALGLWHRGQAEQSLQLGREAIAAAGAFGHANTLAFALAQGGLLSNALCRRAPAVEEHAARLLDVAKEFDLQFWTVFARYYLGWARAAQGRDEEGVALMQDFLTRLLAMNFRLWTPFMFAQLAEVHGRLGAFDEGLRLLDQGKAIMEGGERWLEAEHHRVNGGLMKAKSMEREAEACCRLGLEIARGQEAKLLELRAATSLARLWQGQGKVAEARDLLAPIYGWFTEGFDLADLKDAKALLDELA